MATFYLLPPRPLLEESFARFLGDWLPGLPTGDAGVQLADALQASVLCQGQVFLVFREELPEDSSTSEALRDGFGAEEGDEVVELRLASPTGGMETKRWRLDAAA